MYGFWTSKNHMGMMGINMYYSWGYWTQANNGCCSYWHSNYADDWITAARMSTDSYAGWMGAF